MAHRFEITKDVEVGATPEEVWEAIATGPGMDSWFMGQSEVEPREGGRARWSIGGYTEDSTVTIWDPPKRFVNTGTGDRMELSTGSTTASRTAGRGGPRSDTCTAACWARTGKRSTRA